MSVNFLGFLQNDFFQEKARYQPVTCKEWREAKRAEKAGVAAVDYIIEVFNMRT